MTVMYQVTSKTIAPNGNITIVANMWDDGDPKTVYTDTTVAATLTDAVIAAWAMTRFGVLSQAQTNFAGITANQPMPASQVSQAPAPS